MYQITDYSYNQAKKLNVKITPSKFLKYKIDIYDKNNKYMFSIGDDRYYDYPTYLLNYNKEYADKRRKLYKLRHQKDREIIGSRGWYADKILW